MIIRYYVCVHVCKSLGVDDMSINLGGKYLLLQYSKLKNDNFYVKSPISVAWCGKVLKNAITLKNFREINSLVTSLAKTLI